MLFEGLEAQIHESPQGRRRRWLVDHLEFSRRLTPTYLILAVVLLSILACYHWVSLAICLRRLRAIQSQRDDVQIREGIGGQASQSNSVPKGPKLAFKSANVSQTQRQEVLKSADPCADEETPLLQSTTGRRNSPSKLLHIIIAFLVYQPKQIPAITAPQNLLPSNGRTLVILLLFIPNLFYLFYRMPISVDSLLLFADRAGLCFTVNLPILYLLGAKNQPLRILTGRSYEDLNIFHRRLGEWMIILATIHGVGMITFFWPLLRDLGYSLGYFLTIPLILLGILTYVAYFIIYITSIGYARQLFYEAFLLIHILAQVAALALLFFHHSASRPYVIASVSIWATDRILLRIFLIPVTLRATAILADDGETVLLSAKVPAHDEGYMRWSLRPNIYRGWHPGQHVFLCIPSLSHDATLQAHPYSIASVPDIIRPDFEEPAHRVLNLIIRPKNGFTLDFLNHLKSKQTTESSSRAVLHNLQVRIDGPYGSTDTFDAVKRADRTLFVAGGSGVAATYPMASAAASAIRKIYSSQEDMIDSPARIAHYWIARSMSHSSWLPPSPLSVMEFLHQAYPVMHPSGGTERLVGTAESKEAARDDLLDGAVGWIEREQFGAIEDGAKIAVVISGPDEMVRQVRNKCSRLVRKGWDIGVYVEKYGW